MKNLKLALCVLLAVSAVSCNKEGRFVSDRGMISFNVKSNYDVTDVATKSQVSEFTTLPASGNFTIVIKNDASEQVWNGLIADWDPATTLPAGNYSVTAAFGEEGVEGFNKPYLTGSTDFVISGGATTDVKIPVELGNSIVRVVTTPMFDNYYTGYTFTVTTGNGFAIEFAKGETRGAFVDAWTFKVTGSLTSQSGNVLSFEKNYPTLEARTCYTLKFDVADVSGSAITVSFDDATETVKLEDVELND